MTVMYWLIAAAAFVLLEILTMGLTTVWFAVGALVGAALAALGLSLWVQILAFAVVSAVVLFITRPLARKYLNNRTVRTNAESLIGCVCMVTQTIDNLRAEGQVTVKGQVWTARSVSEEKIIPENTKVKITAISGVKVIVEPAKEQE